MPKFEVKIKRMLDHTATIIVEAEDEDAATEAAVEQAKSDRPKVEWELEDEEFEVEDSSAVEDEDSDDAEDEA